jgi:hypothetical protein
MRWNIAQIEQLRELVASGASSSSIGAQLGFSRNAIAGARRRFSISPPLQPEQPTQDLRREPPQPKPRRATPVKDRRETAADARTTTSSRADVRQTSPQHPYVGPVTLLQLEWWMCRWPLDGSELRFCGQPAEAGRPYCDQHARLSRR